MSSRSESVEKLISSLGFSKEELIREHSEFDKFSSDKAALAWVLLSVLGDDDDRQ